VKMGRKPSLKPHQQREARALVAAGETQRSAARSYNVSEATISRLVGCIERSGVSDNNLHPATFLRVALELY
jgi:transposase